jgi:Na+-transporting methylmalonyl-CoA/oxaloacetate decarboxylase gamma subunit
MLTIDWDMVLEGLVLSGIGILVVYVALFVTQLVIGFVARVFREKPPVPASKAAPLQEVAFGQVDRHVLVLLAAAAAVAVKRPVRIRRVRFVSHKHIPASWASAGRAEHMQESL